MFYINKLEFQKEAKLKQDEYLNKMREYQVKINLILNIKLRTVFLFIGCTNL